MQIGKFDLSRYPIILAPMDGITDKVFRKICKEMGATLTYSEFVSADAIIRNVKVSFDKISKNEDEFPFVVQIFGNDPEIMGQAAKLVESAGADIIDLNFGCPMKKIVSKGAGAALLKNPELMLEITKNVVKSVNVPVTVKTRLGWDETSIIIDNIARGLQDCGIAALTLHARTRKQLYSGNADWDYFLKLKSDSSFSIPLIANGDIDNPEKAKLLFDDYGVDGVMIGRAAIGNPWIFRDCNDYILKNISPKSISINERLAICERHLNELAAMKNEKIAIIEMRKFFKNYFKGIANIKQYRVALLEATSLEEIYSIFNNIKDIERKV
ncbi:MAG TPA: tRNA dihydrouridine synthase DusB [Bacteroidales bacterium]|nr:tRNA dihydrouridine synthase DusB [Bacteroidales bacterium]